MDWEILKGIEWNQRIAEKRGRKKVINRRIRKNILVKRRNHKERIRN